MSSIMQYNGAAVIAMAGKDCIAIASDKRYGIRNQTMGCEMKKIFQVGDKAFVGLTGLATDMQTLEQKFRFRSNMYRLREERDMSVEAFANMVTSLLYESRCVVPTAPPGTARDTPLSHLPDPPGAGGRHGPILGPPSGFAALSSHPPPPPQLWPLLLRAHRGGPRGRRRQDALPLWYGLARSAGASNLPA